MKVSLIVPVYNSEKYLNKCLETIYSQTIQNFEVILVDDGSIDFSGKICDEYAEKHKNTKVIHKANEGLICARIAGIKEANNDYIAFVDSDDWIENDFLQYMIENMMTNNADIVACGCIKEYSDKSVVVENQIASGIYDKKNMPYSKILYSGGFFEFGILPYMWNKLFKKKMLLSCYDNIDTSIYDGEDAAIIYPYLIYSEKTVVSSEAKYHYRIHDRMMTSEKKEDYFENVSKLYLHLNNKFKLTDKYECMLPQLEHYMRMMVWNKKSDIFIEAQKYIFPFKDIPKDSKIVLYGAGYVGKSFKHQIELIKYCDITAWVDKNCNETMKNIGVENIKTIKQLKFDYIVIAVAEMGVQIEIIRDLINMGIDKDIIVCGVKNYWRKK